MGQPPVLSAADAVDASCENDDHVTIVRSAVTIVRSGGVQQFLLLED